MDTTFESIGIITVAIITLILLCFIVLTIIEFIQKLIGKYRYKHRFNRKPTAKCYCKDCKNRNVSNGLCNIDNINHCRDDFFCADAEPMKSEYIDKE